MLLKWKDLINSKKFILGSSSEPKKRILSELGLNFESISSNFPENLKISDPLEYVEKTCKCKFDCIINDNPFLSIDFLLTADTIITLDGKILEKAINEEQAYEWYLNYSDKEIYAFSTCTFGIIEKDDDGKNRVKSEISFTRTTKIKMIKITSDIAKWYLSTGEWKYGAGALQVQFNGKLLVDKIDGCYWSVVGLPISDLSFQIDKLLEAYFK